MTQLRPKWAVPSLVVVLGLFASPLSAQGYRNVSNVPWATVSDGPQEAIIVDIDGVAPRDVHRLVAKRVRQVQRAMTEAARPRIRELKRRGLMPQELQWPVTHIVVLRKDGRLLAPPPSHRDVRGADNEITIEFSTAQGETFDEQYRAVLQAAYDDTKTQLTADYGQPYQSANVLVVNYDAEIGDRDAVVGGIFLPSDPLHGDRPTILFPVYLNLGSAAVNFVNLLAHAYHGAALLDFDAWEQGFSRAVTMKVVRTVYPDTHTFPDGSTASMTLDSTYEGRYYYDWWNQPALGNSTFIAPSLRQVELPPGFTGGPWLSRYLMAGSAWAKVLTERSDFFIQFHARYYTGYDANPAVAGDVPALIQMATEALGDGGNPTTVEGREFYDWFRRQHILNSSVQVGRKLYTWLFPLCAGLQAGETGVFVLMYDYFQTDKTGDEALLAGVAYPLYWTFDFARMNLGPQYERVDFQGGWGGVVPSFTENTQIITIDTPVAEVISRVVLPLGTVCQESFTNNFYGTVTGLAELEPETGKAGSVHITMLGGEFDADIIRGAFGLAIPESAMEVPQRVTIDVYDLQQVLVGTYQANIGPERAAITLHATDTGTTITRNYPYGIQMVSLPLFPYENDAAAAFGIPAGEFLFARWRQDLYSYTYYPSTPPIQPGYAFFLKPKDPMPNVAISGQKPPPDLGYAVPLQVGWNQIGNPVLTAGSTPLTDVWVQSGVDDPAIGWDEAAANGYVSSVVFRFDQNISDPNTGTNVEATEFAAFKGYWVRVLAPEGITILFRPVSALGPRRAYSPPEPTGWSVKMTLRSEAGDTAAASIATDPEATDGFDALLDAELPPPFGQGLQLALRPEAGQGGDLYRDVRREGRQHEWTVRAVGLLPGKSYTLSWPSLSTLRRRLSLLLSDPATGRRANIRAATSFTFVADGPVKELRIESKPAVYAGLQITAFTVNPTRGGVSAAFSLTQEATVNVSVLALTGKAVRQLKAAVPMPAGITTVTWDRRDQQGISLPPGQYVLSVEAVADDGTVARAVRPVVITR
jgi:hypothetical protein